METGTQNKGDVDFDWLPMDHINSKFVIKEYWAFPGHAMGNQATHID